MDVEVAGVSCCQLQGGGDEGFSVRCSVFRRHHPRVAGRLRRVGRVVADRYGFRFPDHGSRIRARLGRGPDPREPIVFLNPEPRTLNTEHRTPNTEPFFKTEPRTPNPFSPMPLESLIRQAAANMESAGLFFGHGTDNAIDEACWAASYVFGLPPDFGDEALAGEVSDADRARFEALVAERIQTRKPLAYLIGQAWFAGLAFEVDENVLVPRSPLAELIVEGFAPWIEPGRLRRVVDVGTGSGCLAIATAVYWPEVKVDAVDISPEALALARRNAERHDVADRVEAIESDLLDALDGRRYDVILANPPYVPTASMAELPEEYRWEPALGLEAGEDGLDLVRRLLDTAAEHLEAHGVMIIEVGEAAEALETLLVERGIEFTWLEFEHGGDGVALIERGALRLA